MLPIRLKGESLLAVDMEEIRYGSVFGRCATSLTVLHRVENLDCTVDETKPSKVHSHMNNVRSMNEECVFLKRKR